MAKRSLTDGSIYKYKHSRGGSKWRFQVWVPTDIPGQSVRVGQAGFRTAEDAKKALFATLQKAKTQTVIVKPGSIPSFNEFATRWLASLNRLQGTTYQGYEKNLRCHLLPYLGELRLDAITSMVLNQHFKRLSEAGRKDVKNPGGPLSANTLHKIGTVLSLLFESAVDENLLSINPMKKVKLAPVRRADHELSVWTLEQMEMFLNWNEIELRDDLNVLWRLICYTGMRRGEALALKWGDIDMEERTLKIVRATDASMARAVKETKTRSSRRNIPLDRTTIEALKRHKSIREAIDPELGQAEAWVFGGRNGDLRGPNDTSARWRRAVSKAVEHFGSDQLPPTTLKGLRHSHATALLECNVNPKVVQERLGHSAFHVTMNTYSHVTRTMQDTAISEIEKRLNRS